MVEVRGIRTVPLNESLFVVILPPNQNNFVNKFITYHISIILILPEKVNSL